jgi:hypothetical protein
MKFFNGRSLPFNMSRRNLSMSIARFQLPLTCGLLNLIYPFLSVTAHYINSPAGKPQKWELKTKQLAFTIINSNHSGSNIGRILIETINNYDIHTKVRWFTADNATNNNMAIQTVVLAIDPSGKKWIAGEHHVR